MKCTKPLALLAAVLCLSIAVSGCKKKPQGVTSLPQRGPGSLTGPEMPSGPAIPPGRIETDITPRATMTNVTSGELPPTARTDLDSWDQDRERFKAETIYFDFDKSNIRPDQTHKLDAVFAAMQGMPGKGLRIEGNCDERGTEEYNRALGERRALAAREYLARKGMDPSLILTISYGKDKPAELGHNEAAWSKNRRDDFILLSPKGQ